MKPGGRVHESDSPGVDFMRQHSLQKWSEQVSVSGRYFRSMSGCTHPRCSLNCKTTTIRCGIATFGSVNWAKPAEPVSTVHHCGNTKVTVKRKPQSGPPPGLSA